MKRTLVAFAAITTTVALVALFAVAQDPTTYTDVTVTDDLVVTDDASVGGDLTVTGSITGFSSETITVATTMDSTLTVSGTFTASAASAFTKAVVCASTMEVTGAITATGGVAGALTGSAAGALGNFTVVESDTLKPGSGTAFYLRAKDGHDDADLNCCDFSGNLTGNVSGNTSTLFQSVAYKGNLPTTSSGEETGEFFKNTVGDSGWVADNDSWVQLWP